MLSLLNLLQLLLYIPLLALIGQAVLYLLAGPGRRDNVFYRLLQLLSKPFTAVVRRITPARVAEPQVPVATFFVLLIAYAIVTVEKISLCVRIGVALCQ
jgi:hypothetical protein